MIQLQDIRGAFKWFLIAVVFDLLHYHIWGFFRSQDQLYIYDSLELIKGSLYVYAGVQVFQKIGKFHCILCKTFFFYVILDTFIFIYDFEGLISESHWILDSCTIIFSLFCSAYVYRDALFHSVVSRVNIDS